MFGINMGPAANLVGSKVLDMVRAFARRHRRLAWPSIDPSDRRNWTASV